MRIDILSYGSGTEAYSRDYEANFSSGNHSHSDSHPNSQVRSIETEGKCIEPAIEVFHRKHQDKQLRKPEYYFETSTNFGRSYKIRIFIPRGEAKTLFVLQPELADMIINRWDLERKKQ